MLLASVPPDDTVTPTTGTSPPTTDASLGDFARDVVGLNSGDLNVSPLRVAIFVVVLLIIVMLAFGIIWARVRGTIGFVKSGFIGVIYRFNQYREDVIRVEEDFTDDKTSTLWKRFYWRFPFWTSIIWVDGRTRDLDNPSQTARVNSGKVGVSFDVNVPWRVVNAHRLVKKFESQDFEPIVRQRIMNRLSAFVRGSDVDEFLACDAAYLERFKAALNADLNEMGIETDEPLFQNQSVERLFGYAMAGELIAGYNARRDQLELQEFLKNAPSDFEDYLVNERGYPRDDATREKALEMALRYASRKRGDGEALGITPEMMAVMVMDEETPARSETEPSGDTVESDAGEEP